MAPWKIWNFPKSSPRHCSAFTAAAAAARAASAFASSESTESVMVASLVKEAGEGWMNGSTLQGINISHLGKRKIIFKMPFLGDMLVPWRVLEVVTPQVIFCYFFTDSTVVKSPWPTVICRWNKPLPKKLFWRSNTNNLRPIIPKPALFSFNFLGISLTIHHTLGGNGRFKKLKISKVLYFQPSMSHPPSPPLRCLPPVPAPRALAQQPAPWVQGCLPSGWSVVPWHLFRHLPGVGFATFARNQLISGQME